MCFSNPENSPVYEVIFVLPPEVVHKAMVLAVHVGQRWILNDAQHQVRHDPRILHNICPRPVVALRIGGNVADIELDGRGASVELIVQPGLDQAIKELPQSK